MSANMSYAELVILPINRPEEYERLTLEERAAAQDWIKSRLKAVSTYASRRNSYGLKHHMEREIGLYVTNGAFKGAMEAAGFKAYDTDEVNWTYRVRLRKEKR